MEKQGEKEFASAQSRKVSTLPTATFCFISGASWPQENGLTIPVGDECLPPPHIPHGSMEVKEYQLPKKIETLPSHLLLPQRNNSPDFCWGKVIELVQLTTFLP